MSKVIQTMGGGKTYPFNIITIQKDEYSIKRKPATRPVLKVKRFCETCNTGWMSSLEKAVGPIITPAFSGGEIRLTPAKQRLISEWMLKNALVYDLAPHPYPAYNALPEYFRYLYENREPWSTVQVVLARYGGSRISDLWNVSFAHDVVRPRDEVLTRVQRATPSAHKADGFVTTLQVGQFVCQVLCYPEGGKNPFYAPGGGTNPYQRGDLHIPGLTIPIWPVKGRPKWPPKKTLNDDGLHQLAGDSKTQHLER